MEKLPQTIRGVFSFLVERLLPFGKREAESMARILLEDGLGLPHARASGLFPFEHWPRLLQMLEEVLQGKPIAYVCGRCWFYGLPLHCDERALIPRPETEELVYTLLEDYPQEAFSRLRVLDIGTGSGCIALALKARRPDWEVLAVDVSEQALSLARENARELQLEVQFAKWDVLQQHEETAPFGVFDLILSNPPYISPSELAAVDAMVQEHEPELALFAPESDPLLFYRAIRTFGESRLKKGGHLYLELNAFRADETRKLFAPPSWRAALRRDMQGKKRFLIARRNP